MYLFLQEKPARGQKASSSDEDLAFGLPGYDEQRDNQDWTIGDDDGRALQIAFRLTINLSHSRNAFGRIMVNTGMQHIDTSVS